MQGSIRSVHVVLGFRRGLCVFAADSRVVFMSEHHSGPAEAGGSASSAAKPDKAVDVVVDADADDDDDGDVPEDVDLLPVPELDRIFCDIDANGGLVVTDIVTHEAHTLPHGWALDFHPDSKRGVLYRAMESGEEEYRHLDDVFTKAVYTRSDNDAYIIIERQLDGSERFVNHTAELCKHASGVASLSLGPLDSSITMSAFRFHIARAGNSHFFQLALGL